jgi:hypothetical protein
MNANTVEAHKFYLLSIRKYRYMTFRSMFIFHSTDTTTLMWKKMIQKYRIKAFLTSQFPLIIDDRTLINRISYIYNIEQRIRC